MQLGDWHDVPWTDFFATQSPKNKIPTTGIDIEIIKTICKAISTPPNDIESHTQVLNYNFSFLSLNINTDNVNNSISERI